MSNALKYSIRVAVFLGLLLFFAIWGWHHLLISGIEDAVDGAKANPTDGSAIVWGIIKLLLIPAFFFLSLLISSFITWVLTGSGTDDSRKAIGRPRTSRQVELDWERMQRSAGNQDLR